MSKELANKILGVLGTCAIGDAMGSVTENLTFDQIREAFPGGLQEFRKPGNTAFALGNEAGEVTDDFSQTYLISQAIVEAGGKITRGVVVGAILKWSDIPRWYDRFAGPTTRGAIATLKDPKHEVKSPYGTVHVDYACKATNGAAMKISPAGIMNPDDVEGAIRDAITICRVTHDNSLAISGACATAAAVSAGLADGATMRDALGAAVYGAMRGETIGKRISHYVAGASVVERMHLADEIVRGPGSKEEKLRRISEVVGSGLNISEAVPCAYGLALLNMGDALQATIDAVNIGYDTDTVAAITGAMVGAFADLEDERYAKLLSGIQKANDFDLVDLASKLAGYAGR